MTKHILCFSGGKDSTAMLIYVLKNKLPLSEVIYVDVGDWMWETKRQFKQMEETLNINITILKVSSEIKEGFEKWGFPSFINRWCTGIKRDTMKKYLKDKYPNDKIVQYIGYCADEVKRTSKKLYSYYDTEYPLVEAGITTEDAIKICEEYGFDFDGVYSHHSHYNCWLCPLQRKHELKYIYIYMPEKWLELCKMQMQTPGYYQSKKTIFQWSQQFWEEEKETLKNTMLKKREEAKKKR